MRDAQAMPQLFVGVDVAESRGCAIAILDQSGRSLGSAWSDSGSVSVLATIKSLAGGAGEAIVGIDSPRMPLPKPRPWYWDRKRADWRSRNASEKGYGRHCEVVIASLRLANPQWTPLLGDEPEWMRVGFELFSTLEGQLAALEVFPSASYAQLDQDRSCEVSLSFCGFGAGPKDMLDAYVAALTVLEYSSGRGCAIGGGDGLGEIILPRPVGNAPAALLAWPAA